MAMENCSSSKTGSVVRRYHCRGGMDSRVRKDRRKEWMVLGLETSSEKFCFNYLKSLFLGLEGCSDRRKRSGKRSRLSHTTRSISVATRAGRIVDKKRKWESKWMMLL